MGQSQSEAVGLKVETGPSNVQRMRMLAQPRALLWKICDNKHANDILAVTFDLPSTVLVVVFGPCRWITSASERLSVETEQHYSVDPLRSCFESRLELANNRKRVWKRSCLLSACRVLAVTVLFCLLHCGLSVWKNWLPMPPHSEVCLHKCTIWPLLCLFMCKKLFPFYLYLPYAWKSCKIWDSVNMWAKLKKRIYLWTNITFWGLFL